MSLALGADVSFFDRGRCRQPVVSIAAGVNDSFFDRGRRKQTIVDRGWHGRLVFDHGRHRQVIFRLLPPRQTSVADCAGRFRWRAALANMTETNDFLSHFAADGRLFNRGRHGRVIFDRGRRGQRGWCGRCGRAIARPRPAQTDNFSTAAATEANISNAAGTDR